jgi:hypothetical protein
MSLGIVFKGTEGIVLAADSRVTLMATLPHLQNPAPNQQIIVPATFDNATKLLRVRGQDFIGTVTFGTGAIGLAQPRTASSYIPEFESELPGDRRLSVEEFAKGLSDFFLKQWRDNHMPANPMLHGPPFISCVVFAVRIPYFFRMAVSASCRAASGDAWPSVAACRASPTEVKKRPICGMFGII